MKYSEVENIISSIGLPYSYYQFPEGTGQAPPFICFFYPQSDDVYADNSNYQSITQLIVELYTDSKDIAQELDVEAKLAAAGLSWEKESEYLGDERMQFTRYTMEVVING